uniref:Uncharacterized protein n=1 Tax=viral metagenome TaxID=1070528 RepID=A0A6M3L1F1_9ZZZZ
MGGYITLDVAEQTDPGTTDYHIAKLSQDRKGGTVTIDFESMDGGEWTGYITTCQYTDHTEPQIQGGPVCDGYVEGELHNEGTQLMKDMNKYNGSIGKTYEEALVKKCQLDGKLPAGTTGDDD